MDTLHPEGAPQSYWFVGSAFNGTQDQTQRFVDHGIWENDHEEKFRDLVRAMRPGDRIAIKSTYTRKKGLPFENRGKVVSVMAIKAFGTISKNFDDGMRIQVDWSKQEIPPREWYFYTYRNTVQQVNPGKHWETDGLIEFAFNGAAQNIERFLNEPTRRAQYESSSDDERFHWTTFYEAIAERLLEFREDREPLIESIHEIASRAVPLPNFQDQFPDGTRGPLKDICPFTVMATFNRGMKDSNRQAVARELATFLGVELPAPDSFAGVPVVSNQNTWFFGYSRVRDQGDIDTLWSVYSAALYFARSDTPKTRLELTKAYDRALAVKKVKWNLSMGLYWLCPWGFAALDGPARKYISKHLGLHVPTKDKNSPGDGTAYLHFLDELKSSFIDDDFPVRSIPELSLAAWNLASGKEPPNEKTDDRTNNNDDIIKQKRNVYSVSNILEDGCFLEQREIERLLERLETRKNLILQGPPGTGKTWLSRRLAFALTGVRDDDRVRSVQFHPNLSYEDFVRGWRPVGDGKLALADGVFMEAIRTASENASERFVVVIEEINRGNPAQIFGELLTLLEADKRSPRDAVELCYPDSDGMRRPIHIPGNLYVIGTMNIADRSLALVDLALRRRFAFVTLEPRLGETWRGWVIEKGGMEPELAEDIVYRITELNNEIAADPNLGKQFRIGHSYVTPTKRLGPGTTRDWFGEVVETEIGPLLEEYWFDSPERARLAIEKLSEGW